jgi:cytochrome oxidase assembly protein ShyY1
VYRFAFRGRWLVGHFVVLALAGLFVLAGFWQLDRLHQVRTQNALIVERRAMPVANLADLVRASDRAGDAVVQRRVAVGGRFDPAHQAFEFAEFNQQPGVDLLTPLMLDDGTAVIVDRGWVPAEPPQQPIPSEAAPPAADVRVTGTALAGSQGGSLGETGGLIQVTQANLGLLQAKVPYDLYPVVVRLADQTPAQPSGLPRPVPPPVLDEGPHLSYAVQWFTFTAIGLIGWPLLLRKAVRDRAKGAGS